MDKNVYSLVLMDEVVRAVDRAAYEQGVNRSYLINRILADHLSLTTPEMRMRSILDAANRWLEQSEGFRRLALQSDSAMAAQSALQFQYNPVVNYQVRLFRGQRAGGQFRLAARTQNAGLSRLLQAFFRAFMHTERQLLPFSPEYLVKEHTLTRQLRLEEASFASEQALGEAIGAYVQLADRCLKAYCALADLPGPAGDQLAALYQGHLQTHPVL